MHEQGFSMSYAKGFLGKKRLVFRGDGGMSDGITE